MMWFPQNWTDADIRAAVIYVATKRQLAPGKTREYQAVFRGVKVSVFIDFNNRVGTICPSYNQII